MLITAAQTVKALIDDSISPDRSKALFDSYKPTYRELTDLVGNPLEGV